MKKPKNNKDLETLNLIDFFRIFIAQKNIFLFTTLIITLMSSIYAFNRTESVTFTSSSLIKIGSYDDNKLLDTGHLQEDIFYIYGIDVKIVMRDFVNIQITSSEPTEAEKLNQTIVDYILDLSQKKADYLIKMDKISIQENEEILDVVNSTKNKINQENIQNESESFINLSHFLVFTLETKQTLNSFKRSTESYLPTEVIEDNTTKNYKRQAPVQQIIFSGLLLGLVLSVIFSIGMYRKEK